MRVVNFIDREKADAGLALILEAFHSGTAPVEHNTAILDFVHAHPASRIMIGSLPKHLKSALYGPTDKLVRSGVPVYGDAAPHYIRARMVAGLADGKTIPHAMKPLERWRVKPAQHAA